MKPENRHTLSTLIPTEMQWMPHKIREADRQIILIVI